MAWRWPWTPPALPTPDMRERTGFFESDDEPRPRIDRAALHKLIFQRTAQDVRRVSGNGQLSFAMDSADYGDESLKQVWLANASSVPDAQWAWYAAQSFIGYQMCAILAQHWLVDRACSRPAKDATRVNYEITAADETAKVPKGVFEDMKKLDKRFKLKANAREFVRKSRIFGIRIALFVVDSDDPDYYLKPFNPDGVKPGSYRGISQVDPYWITPELNFVAAADTASIHFYEPTFWRINGKRYHRSHLVITTTNEVPDVLKPTYYFGGVPLTQQIYERVYAAERTANEAPQLALTKRVTVITGANLVAGAGQQSGIENRMAEFASQRDNYGVNVLGGSEELTQQDTSLTDFNDVMLGQYQLVAAIAEMPVTKLLGTSPKGMDATGEFEEADYHETLEGILEHDVAPLYERHHLLSMRSYIMPKYQLAKPIETTVVFDELDAETSKEKAERTKIEAERDKLLAETGALDGIDIRERLASDEESGYTGLEAATPEEINQGAVGPPPPDPVALAATAQAKAPALPPPQAAKTNGAAPFNQ